MCQTAALKGAVKIFTDAIKTIQGRFLEGASKQEDEADVDFDARKWKTFAEDSTLEAILGDNIAVMA